MFTWTENVEKRSYHDRTFPVIIRNEPKSDRPIENKSELATSPTLPPHFLSWRFLESENWWQKVGNWPILCQFPCLPAAACHCLTAQSTDLNWNMFTLFLHLCYQLFTLNATKNCFHNFALEFIANNVIIGNRYVLSALAIVFWVSTTLEYKFCFCVRPCQKQFSFAR